MAFADGNPPNNVSNINNFDLEDRPASSGQSQPATPWIAVTPEYFGVMGLKLLEGRLLNDSDATRENLETVMVDRAWARRFFPNGERAREAFPRRGLHGVPVDQPWSAS